MDSLQLENFDLMEEMRADIKEAVQTLTDAALKELLSVLVEEWLGRQAGIRGNVN